MIIMIDNYDSFTYNLVQYFKELGADITVFRNDKITATDVSRLAPQGIVISPGPGAPNDAGISIKIVQEFTHKIPILGVCLGHQTIGQVFGGQVVRARQVMHGKVSFIHHKNSGVFESLPSPFEATRYHSLVVAKDTLPDCLEVTAWTQTVDGQMDEIMGIRHKHGLLEGVQFHPESILTQHGKLLLNNFLQKCVS